MDRMRVRLAAGLPGSAKWVQIETATPTELHIELGIELIQACDQETMAWH